MRFLILILILFVGACSEPKDPFHVTVETDGCIYHIVGTSDQIDEARAKYKNDGKTGLKGFYVYSQNTIDVCYVIGYRVGNSNQIIPDYRVLGHEVAHKMNYVSEQVANPDEVSVGDGGSYCGWRIL